MQLSFHVIDQYLLTHTLSGAGSGAFSSSERATVVDVQNEAWQISQSAYNLLTGRLSPSDLANLGKITDKLPDFFQTIIQSGAFKKLREETEHYRSICEKQWERNRERTTKIVHALTGFDLNRSFSVCLTHPSLKNGRMLDDNHLAWGHHEEWKSYTTVYLWHEVLHAYLDRSETAHALIELIADNELRTQLNGGAYPPFTGHPHLFPIMERVLPAWKRYLATKTPRDIQTFQRAISE
jgi:hypothetical protein